MSTARPANARRVQSAVDACAAALRDLTTSDDLSQQSYRVGQAVEIKINTSAPDACTHLRCEVNSDQKGAECEQAELLKGEQEGWIVRFAPSAEDTYILSVTWAGKHISGSPFRLRFVSASEPKKIVVRGIGDGTHWTVTQPVQFSVDTRSAGKGQLIVRASGPTQGIPKFNLHDNGDGTYKATYIPSAVGEHSFDITYADEPIPGSPFSITVDADMDVTAVRVQELTIPEAVDGSYIVGQAAEFLVDASACTVPSLPPLTTRVSAVTSDSQCKAMISHVSEQVYRVRLQPSEPDTFLLGLFFGSEALPSNPHRLCFGRAPEASRCQVLGLFPDGWLTMQPVSFHVATAEAGVGRLTVDVNLLSQRFDDESGRALNGSESPHSLRSPASPSRAPVGPLDISVEKDGSLHTVQFKPAVPGYYNISIRWADRHVTGSPFRIGVAGHQPDATQCRLIGNDVHRQFFKIGDSYSVIVNCERAGPGQLQVNVTGAIVDDSEFCVDDLGDGCYELNLAPSQPGDYTLDLGWADAAIPGCPLRMYFANDVDVSKCLLEGTGLAHAELGNRAEFQVITRGTGLAPLSASMADEKGRSVPVEVIQTGPATHCCAYTVHSPSNHILHVRYGNVDVPGSPFQVRVTQPFAPERCKILGGRVKDSILGKPVQFYVESKEAGPGNLSVEAVSSDSQKRYKGHLSQTVNGKTLCRLNLPTVDRYTTSIKYDGVHIAGSPFKLRVLQPPKPSMVMAFGQGLSNCEIGQGGDFIVDVTDAGSGMLGIRVQGPRGGFKVDTTRLPSNDKQILVQYNPVECGQYQINITWADEVIPGSPFLLTVYDPSQNELGLSV
ncbi:filamin-C-like [Sycon ciliatum]|uniref:filamin-C-like n=1 Tax=Sycon ciliatum TaxID=27933 RepID=UPI0031F71E00|eukprot:scpid19597/ scgid4183/ Filamin-C; ABP-280-like protein; ABP-L; Actin-binding-like protein; Filamin-2; Gamma-filamin